MRIIKYLLNRGGVFVGLVVFFALFSQAAFSQTALSSTELSSTELSNAELKKSEGVKRIALFAASNDGGLGRQLLKYAESDALSLAKVFEELGGLSPLDNTILLSPTKQNLKKTLKELEKRLAMANSAENNRQYSRTEFIFYYSGHSDREGIMLKDGNVSYRELKDLLLAVKSDVRIAILDSCQSGVFTRLKGGKRVAPFLVNEANRVSGDVFLSASSEDEAAQESDEIGASFFTHHFISALRGASDVSNDKQITLNEAYQYAFNQTLDHTTNSLAGAQHPAYNFQIAGAGDLVLTDLKLSSSTLIIPANIIGRLYVRDKRGSLVVELNKVLHKPLTVALEEGDYSVVLESNPDLLQTDIALISGEALVLNYPDFNSIDRVENRIRGNSLYSVKPKEHERKYSLGVGGILSNIRFEYLDDGFFLPPNAFPLVVKREYQGYEVMLTMTHSDYSDVTLNYFNASGWGELEGVALMFKQSVYQNKMAINKYLRFYIGAGLFVERFNSFPVTLVEYYGESVRNLIQSELWGVQIPVGVKAVEGDFTFSLEVRAKFARNSSVNYRGNNRINAIAFNVGYQM